MSSLKHKTISGIVWSSIERFSVQGTQFVIQVIMARILLPEDYGVIAMLAIFLAVFQSLIDSGFTSALVQKSDRTETDYATVFYFNIIISIVLFFVLFLSSPLIADFYKTPLLVPVTKVIALNLLINALSVVPRAKLTIFIDFKTQAKASLTAVIVSGAVGIWMAYEGYGVWALVWQSILNNSVNTLLLWIFSKWWPLFTFSIKSFKRLFSFGFKLLLSGLLDTVFRNLYTLVIGKKFAAQDLGYYSRADQFAQFPSSNLSSIIGRVAFPVMCEAQASDVQLQKIFCKFLRVSTFIIFPLMLGLAALSEPFIRLFLTEKWMGTVLLLQLLCLSYMWYPIHGLNLTLIQVKGRSDLFLRLEIIKKIIGVIILIITIPMGLIPICVGTIFSSLLSLYVNVYYTNKFFSIGLLKQLKYIGPSLILSVMMGVIVFLLTKIGLSDIFTLLLGFGLGTLFYIGCASIMKMQEWTDLLAILTQYTNKLFFRRNKN